MHFFRNSIASNTKRIWTISLICIFVTTLPYAYGYFASPDEARYSGIHHIVQGDTNVYLTMIGQSKVGHVLYDNLFTSEPNARVLFNPLWLVLGYLAKLISASPLFVFHIGRIALIPVFVCVIDRLIAIFITDDRTRKITLILAVFASGIGLFFDPVLFDAANPYNRPMDIWAPESNTFLSMLQSPHFLLSQILLLTSLLFTLKAFLGRVLRYAIYAGIAAAALFLIHPFYVPTIWGVIAIWCIVLAVTRMPHWRFAVWTGTLTILISAPILYYFLWMDRTVSVIHIWSAQNNLPSPHFYFYLIGYGLLIPFALYGAIKTFSDVRWRLLTMWLLTTAALVYAPVDFQRRLIEGAHVILAILAGPVIVSMYQSLRKTSWLRATWFAMLLIVLLPLTNVKMVVQDIFDYTFEPVYPYYIPAKDTRAFDWLATHTNEQDVIFSSYITGNYIPAYSLRRVFLGHGPQTIFLKDKEALAAYFYAHEASDEWRRSFLKTWNITYVMWCEHERTLGPYNPHAAPFLEAVYEQEGTALFRVIPEI